MDTNILNNSFQHHESFVTIKPESEKIRRYISYYYFHASDDENYNKSFVFYPNYKHALTVYQHSEVTLTETESIVNPSEKTTIKRSEERRVGKECRSREK